MAVIDHHEALQWTVDWGIPSSRAKSRESLHGSCFTSTFVLLSLAGVWLFRGRSAFKSDEVLTFPVWSRRCSKQQCLDAFDRDHTARVHMHQYQLKEQGLKLVTVFRRVNFMIIRSPLRLTVPYVSTVHLKRRVFVCSVFNNNNNNNNNNNIYLFTAIGL